MELVTRMTAKLVSKGPKIGRPLRLTHCLDISVEDKGEASTLTRAKTLIL